MCFFIINLDGFYVVFFDLVVLGGAFHSDLFGDFSFILSTLGVFIGGFGVLFDQLILDLVVEFFC